MAVFVPKFLRSLRDVLIAAPADGDVLAYDDASSTWQNVAGGGGGGAPTTADYLVGTANGSLSAEIVVGTSPGGELGGTWASPTVDATHSGSSHAAVQAAAEATAAAALLAHTSDTSDAHDASAISIADAANDFSATDVEGALAELQSDHEADATNLADHLADSSAAHAASAISADSTTLVGTGTDVQAVLEELDNGIADHLADATAAHAASAISFSAVGNIAGTDAQTAIAEVATDAASALSTHESDTTSVHGITDTSTLYRSGGTDVALADGGTGASLADPNADRIMFWDDSAGAVTWLTPGTGLTITTTTIDAAGGSVAADAIFDAKGDLAVGTGADTAAKLTVGANGKVVIAASGESTGLKYDYPPGYELDYAEATSSLTVTATTEGTAQTFITGNSVSFDGSTKAKIEFYAPFSSVLNGTGVIVLLEDSTVIGWVCEYQSSSATVTVAMPLYGARFRTPSNGSHTYYAKAWKTAGTVGVGAGSGGSGTEVPAFLRVTKA